MNVYHICILSDRPRIMLELSYKKLHQIWKRREIQLYLVQIGVKHIRIKPIQRWPQTNRQVDARQPAPYSAGYPQRQAAVARYLQREDFIFR